MLQLLDHSLGIVLFSLEFQHPCLSIDSLNTDKILQYIVSCEFLNIYLLEYICFDHDGCFLLADGVLGHSDQLVRGSLDGGLGVL